jgi:hypothetical protein
MAATFLWRAGEQLMWHILNGQGGRYSWQKGHTQEQEDPARETSLTIQNMPHQLETSPSDVRHRVYSRRASP